MRRVTLGREANKFTAFKRFVFIFQKCGVDTNLNKFLLTVDFRKSRHLMITVVLTMESV